MLYIESQYAEYYNHLIHLFLGAFYFEGFDDEEKIDVLGNLFPDYLIRDNATHCLTVADDLYYWSKDEFIYKLDSIHQLALYNFLEFVAGYRRDMGREMDVFYREEESQRLIDGLWKSLDMNELFDKDISKREFINHVQNIHTMLDECFEDIDFITFPQLLGTDKRHKIENPQSIKGLIDDYGGLLPRDILADYQRKLGVIQSGNPGDELFDEVVVLIKRVSRLITHGEINRLIATYSERDIHRVLRAMFDMALNQNKDIYLIHEFLAAGASIDFVFSKGGESVPVEVKLASSPSLKHGIEKQLVSYAAAVGASRAIAIIVCQSDRDIRKIDRLRNISNKALNIEIIAIDARLKEPASKI